MNKKQSGFTIIEILVVMIIIGFLAAIAITHVYSNVERSHANEAFMTLGVVKRSIELCAMSFNNDFTTCNDYGTIGFTDPSYNTTSNAGAHFSYLITTSANSFQITATRNTIDNGNSTDVVVIDRAASGLVVRSGTTAFAGIQ